MLIVWAAGRRRALGEMMNAFLSLVRKNTFWSRECFTTNPMILCRSENRREKIVDKSLVRGETFE